MSIFLGKNLNKISVKNLGIIIFFAIFFVITWSFLSYRIIDVPPGINGDEAAIGYNAALVARTGYDQSGRFFPLFVSAFDLNDWKQPITFYSTVLAFKIFHPSYAVLREVSVVLILISATLVFFLSRELLGKAASFISLIIFITSPAVLIQSHLALENIAPIPFVILWLWMLVKYRKNFRSRYLFLSALFLGIGLFTYPGMRIIFPVYIILTIVLIYYLNFKQGLNKIIRENIKFLIIVSIFPIFMFSVKDQFPGAILAYNRPHSIPTYQEFILPYISSFDPSFLFIQGDATPYHSTGKQGMFLLATLPIFALGLFRIAQKKDPMLIFLLLTFIFTPLLYGLAASIHRGSRLLVLLPPFTLISTIGFLSIMSINKKWIKFLGYVVVIILIYLNYTDFVRDYWYEYPNRVKSNFSKPYQLVFEKAYNLSKSNNLTPYIQSDFRKQDLIAEDFFEQVYFPNKLSLWQDNQPLPENSVIIVSDFILSKNKNIDQIKIGDGYFGVLINSK